MLRDNPYLHDHFLSDFLEDSVLECLTDCQYFDHRCASLYG